MNYWIWNMRRRWLERRLRMAANRLLDHTGAASVSMPLNRTARAGFAGEIFVAHGVGNWP